MNKKSDCFYFLPQISLQQKKTLYFCAVLNNKTFLIDPWCNWQHVWFWSRRVQVRALAGQPLRFFNIGAYNLKIMLLKTGNWKILLKEFCGFQNKIIK